MCSLYLPSSIVSMWQRPRGLIHSYCKNNILNKTLKLRAQTISPPNSLVFYNNIKSELPRYFKRLNNHVLCKRMRILNHPLKRAFAVIVPIAPLFGIAYILTFVRIFPPSLFYEQISFYATIGLLHTKYDSVNRYVRF